MPGIFGIARRSPDDALPSIFSRMCDPDAVPRRPTEVRVDAEGHWALGRVHLGGLQPEPQLNTNGDVHVLVHGDIYNRSDLHRELGDPAIGTDAAAIIRELYQRRGLALVPQLNGAFCAVVLDRGLRQIALINDTVASYPVYWAVEGGVLVFGSELRSVLRSRLVRRAIDPAAVADYLAFGFPFGSKTLAKDVGLLPPGSMLVYNWASGDVAVHTYDRIADAFQPWEGTHASFLEELDSVFTNAVTRGLSGQHAFGMALSGGMDSRAILSAVNGQSSALTTYTLGVDGCADQVIADRLASIAGTQHRFFELDERYLRDFLPNMARMVSLTDGMYLSHGLTEILALNFLSTLNVDVLLRGHGGELAKASLAWPFHTDARVHAMIDRTTFAPFLQKRVNYISGGVEWAELFTDDWHRTVQGVPCASIETSIAGVDLCPADLCSYIYLQEHHRRFTVASLELFRQAVDIRLPFVDRDFLRVLFRAPAAWRDGLGIHRALTSSHAPRLLHVRNSNTGAAGDAGPLMETALDKVNTLLKRLNVRGYRHYHNFDGWMRQQLLDSVRDVLLSRHAIERGIFKEATLRRIIDATAAGTADGAYLLQVLLIVELWQQENL